MKLIDKALVNFLAMVSNAINSSTEGRFVSDNPIRPDLYSQIKLQINAKDGTPATFKILP